MKSAIVRCAVDTRAKFQPRIVGLNALPLMEAMPISDQPVRRRDALATKARILAAAKECFSDHGYTNSSVRDIAAAADVSYALLGRYFGSKGELFAAAMRSSKGIEALDQFERSQFGVGVARLLVERLTGETAFAMSVLSGGAPEGRTVAAAFMESHVIEPLTQWIGEPGARERAVAASMLIAGFVMHCRRMHLLGPVESITIRHPVVLWLAGQLQALIDDSGFWQSNVSVADDRFEPPGVDQLGQ